jgi:hypothetical protein
MEKVNDMFEYGEKDNYKKFPSLFDAFDLGDRVKRTYKDKNGNKKEYKGIILAINKSGIEVYWDTKNGRYNPGEIDIGFTYCEIKDIFNGNDKYSPIKKYFD